MKLQGAGLALRDIRLGGIDAESDRELSDYFVTTPFVEAALDGTRTLFLGRKGSGKSAVFTQLPRLLGERGDVSAIQLTPDQYAWAALRQYKEIGILPEQAHTNAWKLTLAIEVAGRLLALEKDDWLLPAEESLKVLRSFLTSNFGTMSPGLVKTATSILKGLKAFNFSAFGFGAGFQRELGGQPITPTVVSALLDLLEAPLAEQGVVVELDRLDDSWDGSAESQTLLVGLLKAAKELNDRFTPTDANSGLRTLIFLRSDVYDVLRFDDKDKHRATEEQLVWSADQLRDMVQRRLPEGVSTDELFEEGDMRGSISPFNYIVKRTFLRPREVLQFLEECIRQAGSAAREITKENIRQAEARYSKWKVEDLKQEQQKVFPSFSRLLECLRQEVHRYDSIEDLQALVRSKAPDLADTFQTRPLVEILFETSVIGIRPGNSGSARFKCEDADLALPAFGAVYVHQSLYRGLLIKEARRPLAEDRNAEVGSLQDRVSIELYQRMLSALPIQDLTFLGVSPTPLDILRSASFRDCAKHLGLVLRVDDDGSVTSTIARPDAIAKHRFELNERTFLKLRNEMLTILGDARLSLAEYESEESKRMK